MNTLPKLDLFIRKGDTFAKVLDFNESTQSLTGAKIKAQARRNVRSEVVEVEWNVSIVDGFANISKTVEETLLMKEGNYVYDLEIELPNGFIKTILEGKLTIEDGVTR